MIRSHPAEALSFSPRLHKNSTTGAHHFIFLWVVGKILLIERLILLKMGKFKKRNWRKIIGMVRHYFAHSTAQQGHIISWVISLWVVGKILLIENIWILKKKLKKIILEMGLVEHYFAHNRGIRIAVNYTAFPLHCPSRASLPSPLLLLGLLLDLLHHKVSHSLTDLKLLNFCLKAGLVPIASHVSINPCSLCWLD